MSPFVTSCRCQSFLPCLYYWSIYENFEMTWYKCKIKAQIDAILLGWKRISRTSTVRKHSPLYWRIDLGLNRRFKMTRSKTLLRIERDTDILLRAQRFFKLVKRLSSIHVNAKVWLLSCFVSISLLCIKGLSYTFVQMFILAHWHVIPLLFFYLYVCVPQLSYAWSEFEKKWWKCST